MEQSSTTEHSKPLQLSLSLLLPPSTLYMRQEADTSPCYSITPTHKPTAHSTVVPTTTLAPKTTATETASSTGSQPTETVVTAGVPLTYSGTGTSLVGALAVGVLVGLGLELGL